MKVQLYGILVLCLLFAIISIRANEFDGDDESDGAGSMDAMKDEDFDLPEPVKDMDDYGGYDDYDDYGGYGGGGGRGGGGGVG